MEGGSPLDASQHSHSPLEAEQEKDLTELFTLLDAHPPVVRIVGARAHAPSPPPHSRSHTPFLRSLTA